MADLLAERTIPSARPEHPALPENTGSHGRMTRILVVEDEAQLQRAWQINLRARLYDVMTAPTGRQALALAASRVPDAVILDLGLPDVDGTEVIVELRRWYRPPIIVLSGRISPHDIIGALDAGADDYVTKPFAMGELLTRAGTVTESSDAAGTLRLTPTEWAILQLLLQRPGQLVGSAQLLTSVWGPGFRQRTNYLRFHMAQLRRKLEDNPARPRYLLTEPGMGYRYQPL
jgi:two-component system, OmpR family, KDP operon response regulator KdpE